MFTRVKKKKKKKTRVGMVPLSENEKVGYEYDQNILSALGRRNKAIDNFNSRQSVHDVRNNLGIKLDVDIIDPGSIKGVFEEEGERYLTEMTSADLLDMHANKETINSFMVKLKACDKESQNMAPDNPGKLCRILYMINSLQKFDWCLDIEDDKIPDVHKQKIKCYDFETDLDSMMIIIFQLSSHIRELILIFDYDQSLLRTVQSRVDSNLNLVNNHRVANGGNEVKFEISSLAFQIVSYFRSWMSPSELNARSIKTDTSKLNENSDSFKKATIGLFATKFGDASNFNILSLPTTRSTGNEPIFAWIYGTNMKKKKVIECIKQISVAILMALKPSSFMNIIQNLTVQHPTYSNASTQIPGGVWLARCTWILYSMLENHKLQYIEETYNGKERTCNSFNDFDNFFNSSDENKKNVADKAANNILNDSINSHSGSILRLFDSNLFDCELCMGIGVQLDGSLNDKKIYVCIPPTENQKEYNKIDYYSYGNLPRSLAANTVEDNNITNNIGVKRVVEKDSNTPVALRNQFYSKAWRYPLGEYGVNKDDRMSQKIKLESAALETADSFSPNFMKDTMITYTSLSVSNYSSISQSAGFRLESAYMVTSVNPAITAMEYKTCELSSSCKDMVKDCIYRTYNHIIDNCALYDLQLISDFSSVQQSLLIVLYNASVNALKYNNNSFERLAILIYLRRITDNLSRYYSGRDVSSKTCGKNIKAERKEIKIANNLGRCLLLTIPNRVYDALISKYGGDYDDDKTSAKSFLADQQKSFYPSSLGYRQEAEIRNDLYFETIRRKGRDIGVVVMCSNCGKYCRNLDILHTSHLKKSTDCKSKYCATTNKIKGRLDSDDVNIYTRQVMDFYNSEDKKEKDMGLVAMEQILEGKSIFIQGRAGTGKSFLIQMILELLYIYLHPSQVLVLGPTGLACHNLGEECMTFQFAFGTQGPVISADIEAEFLMIKNRPEVMSRMVATRFLIVDEIGYVHMHVMMILDKVLREAKKKLDVPFGGVQVLVSGQVVQLGPIFKDIPIKYMHLRYSGALSCGLSDLCVPIHLEKIRRNSGDENYMNLSTKAHNGKLNKEDFQLLLTRSGKSVKAYNVENIRHLSQRRKDEKMIEKYIKVVHLTHTWQQMFNYVKESFRIIDIIEKRGNIKTYTISCVHEKQNGELDDIRGLIDDVLEWKHHKNIINMRLYLGCPMMITKNYLPDSDDGCGKNGVRAYWKGVYSVKDDCEFLTDHHLSIKDSNGKNVIERIHQDIKSYHLLFDVEIMVLGEPMVKRNVRFKCTNQDDIVVQGKKRNRFFFPFLYGHVLTAHKTQGMTLALVSTNINYWYANSIRESNGTITIIGYDQNGNPSLFYVMFTRVKNLDSIFFDNIEKCDEEKALQFMNNQDAVNFAWELDWILRAKDTKFNMTLKYLDKVALYNELGKVYQEAKVAQNLRILHLQKQAAIIRIKLLELTRIHQFKLNIDNIVFDILHMLEQYDGKYDVYVYMMCTQP